MKGIAVVLELTFETYLLAMIGTYLHYEVKIMSLLHDSLVRHVTCIE